MSCGCKKKKLIDRQVVPKTITIIPETKIEVIDGEIKAAPDVRPPQVLKAPTPRTEATVEDVIANLNKILKPQQ